jgi:hypothetical protein
VIAYAYMISGPVMWAWSRVHRRLEEPTGEVTNTKVTKTNI